MENIKDIIKGTKAKLTHICEGKVFYRIETSQHIYHLEINSCNGDWKATYLFSEFKTIHLMRWIRKGMQ